MDARNFQARYEGSIPFTRSSRSACVEQETGNDPVRVVTDLVTTRAGIDPIGRGLLAAAVVIILALGIDLATTRAEGATTRPPLPAPRPVTVPTPLRMTASCYGPGLYGNHTANGTRLAPSTVGVAHKSLPLDRPGRRSRILVSHRGRRAWLPVIDRGPFVHGRDLDLTQAAARLLGAATCRTWGVRSVRVGGVAR